MFYKISKISSIILMCILLINSVLFSQVIFADEEETYNDKPVFTRAIVDWDKNIDSLEDLEDNSGIIIRGTILNDKETLMVDDSFGYTKTKVLVNDVINGDVALIDQTITCIEAYFETTRYDTSGYIMCGNYEPAIPGSEYILFLNKYTGKTEIYKGVYFIAYHETGKYLVTDDIKNTDIAVSDYVDSLTNEELNIGPKDSTVYRSIYKSVMEKYVLNSYTEKNESVTETEQSAVTEQTTEETTLQETTQIISKTTVTKTADELGAIIKNDRILIPLRDTAEIMDCIVGWAPDTKTAYLIKDKNTVKFTINSSEYSVNDEVFALDTPAEIYNDKTYIPLRALSEGLGIDIEYNSSDKTVTLTY